jgi:hypothetical protein
LGAEFRTGDRATATLVPSAAEQSLASRRDGGADRRRADVLWRAVDHEGEVLDMLVQRRRDTKRGLRQDEPVACPYLPLDRDNLICQSPKKTKSSVVSTAPAGSMARLSDRHKTALDFRYIKEKLR